MKCHLHRNVSLDSFKLGSPVLFLENLPSPTVTDDVQLLINIAYLIVIRLVISLLNCNVLMESRLNFSTTPEVAQKNTKLF